jgi:hypothetical protein
MMTKLKIENLELLKIKEAELIAIYEEIRALKGE